MMEQLKVKLISKQRPHLRRTKSLTFRLASGERLEELFDPEESTKVNMLHIMLVQVCTNFLSIELYRLCMSIYFVVAFSTHILGYLQFTLDSCCQQKNH